MHCLKILELRNQCKILVRWWKLISCVNLNRHPNILVPRYLNKFHKTLWRYILSGFNIFVFEWRRLPTMMWVGLSNQLETSKKRLTSLKEEINLSLANLRCWTAETLSRVSRLLAYPGYSGLASFHYLIP